jgi:CDP-diacylglycerol--glycerol-3-phosphate 3-phosphatidyltransferase
LSRVWTLPNLLGLFRLAVTPVLVVLVLWPFPGAGLIALVLFVPAALSDLFDGWLARSRGQVTTIGAFLDLTADKVLVSALLVALIVPGLAEAWLVAVIIVREFIVGGVRQVAATEQLLVGSQLAGKAKTVVTLVAIGFLLAAFDAQTGGPIATTGLGEALAEVGTWLLLAGMALAVVSGVDYVSRAWPLLTGRDTPHDSTDEAGPSPSSRHAPDG